jgi:TRAP-type transport system small permease protein
MWRIISKTWEKTERWFIYFCGFLLLSLTCIILIDVTGRFLFRHPLSGTPEISEILLALIIILAMAATQQAGEHIGMDALMVKLKGMKPPLYPCFQVFSLLISEGVTLFLLYYCIKTSFESFALNTTTAGPLYVSMKPIWILICIGLVFLTVRFSIQIYHNLQAARSWSTNK